MAESESKVAEAADRREVPWWVLPITWITIVAVWVFFGWFATAQRYTENPGTFGDMFGAVNALFSGLAFGTLIYTMLLQRRELSLQRQELAATREELSGQRKQLEAQNDLMRRDSFESSFFRVLTMLAQIVDSIDLSGSNPKKGRDCFGRFYSVLEGAYQTQKMLVQAEDTELVKRVYSDFYKKYQGDVGHYFRTLYNLVKLVDRSNVEDKHFYTNLVRAQLSNQEVLLLFYNCTNSRIPCPSTLCRNEVAQPRK